MKITLIHGQNHKGSTYHVARMTAEKISNNIEEFFLPRDLNDGCSGCSACLYKGREHCPHSEKVGIIFDSMLSSDVIVIGSPNYVMGMTSHLKAFFEHIFTAWIGHRPEEGLLSKTAVVVSTGAILGTKSVTESIAKQMFYLGIPKVYKLPFEVMAASWDGVEDKIKKQITIKTDKIAHIITAKKGNTSPGIKYKFIFLMLRSYHKQNDLTLFAVDKNYWMDKGWLGNERPWKHKK